MQLPKRLSNGAAYGRARKQEKTLAKRLGGRTTPASGSKDEKGDVRVAGVVRVECKNTQAKSFSITQDMLDKIEAAALGAGEVPAIQVDFISGQGKLQRSVVVMPTYALDHLLGK